MDRKRAGVKGWYGVGWVGGWGSMRDPDKGGAGGGGGQNEKRDSICSDCC